MAAIPLIIVPWIICLPLSSNLLACLSSLPLSLLSAEPGRELDKPSIPKISAEYQTTFYVARYILNSVFLFAFVWSPKEWAGFSIMF